MDNNGVRCDSIPIPLSHQKLNEVNSKRLRKQPVRFFSLVHQLQALPKVNEVGCPSDGSPSPNGSRSHSNNDSDLEPTGPSSTRTGTSVNSAEHASELLVNHMYASHCGLNFDEQALTSTNGNPIGKYTNIDVPAHTLSVEPPRKLITVDQRDSLPENIDCLPPSMNWLMESGRKKSERVGLLDSHRKPNIPFKVATVQTPAKEIFHTGVSYNTPLNKGLTIISEDFTNHKTPGYPSDRKLEVAPVLIKQDPVHINDSGVVLSSFYSNTKTARSLGGHSTSEYYSIRRQNATNSFRTPLITQEEFCENPGIYSTSSRRNIKRCVLQEKFQALDTNFRQIDPKIDPHTNNNGPSAHQFHSQHTYCDENKENDINYLALDLSDKWRNFQPVDSIQQTSSKDVPSYLTNPDYPLNLKASNPLECQTKEIDNRQEEPIKSLEQVEQLNPGSRLTPATNLSMNSVMPPTQPVAVKLPTPVSVVPQTMCEPGLFTSKEFEITSDHPVKPQSPSKPARHLHAPPIQSQNLGSLLRPDVPSRNEPKILGLYSGQKPLQLTVKNKTYKVVSQLGRGGSGIVYQALDQQSDRLLAIKCVNLAGVDKVSARGYLNEIELLEKLQSCDYVIKLCDYEYNRTTETLYVVMERGDTDFSTLLRRETKNKKLSPLTIVSYWNEMINAVKCIHDNGIIHSDLKPANFLLVSGRLKLIDFGIASTLNVDSTSVIKENAVGTTNYMSPEAFIGFNQTSEAVKISFKSDIWSLGCILYNLVYGQAPFAHIVGQMPRLYAITNENHVIQYPASTECPARFLTIMKACLQYNPKDRPSAAELLRAPFLPQIM